MDIELLLVISNTSSKILFNFTNEQTKARLRHTRLGYAVRLRNYENIKGCKMDRFCGESIDLLEKSQFDTNGVVRIFFMV